jgi:hypothetical protein
MQSTCTPKALPTHLLRGARRRNRPYSSQRFASSLRAALPWPSLPLNVASTTSQPSFPLAEAYSRLRATNAVERSNEDIRRRERAIYIFPPRESALRLLGALLMAQDAAWSTGKRFFDMTPIGCGNARRACDIPSR